MKVIFKDTRDFSMARNMRGTNLSLLTLCLAMAGSVILSPALAREADDVFMPMQVAAPDSVAMMLVRPMQRPDVGAEVSRGETAAPFAILAPQPAERGRIRQVWAIGVFR
jgi:hypothetical protein